MIEFGRELRRFFRGGVSRGDSLTGGDGALLELLDLALLSEEGRAADAAIARARVHDKADLRLHASAVWREAARRSGDPAHLRKAARAAEAAAADLDGARRADSWARARCEQGWCAWLGADLFGDRGLEAVAETAFEEARAVARGGFIAALADVGLAAVAVRRESVLGDADAAMTAFRRFEGPLQALDAHARRHAGVRIVASDARLLRVELLTAWGARLKDPALLQTAIDDAACAIRRLDPSYEPLSWARAERLRGQALALRGEACGELEALSAGAGVLSSSLAHLMRDHSPFDWARGHLALGAALQALGESAADCRLLDQAVTCFDRADLVLKTSAASGLRAQVARDRALCLVRSAELTGDLAQLDAAQAAMKIELAGQDGRRDPVGWALAQTHLARLYEARLDLTGKDRGERVAAFVALDAALEVFAEQGLHSLSAFAAEAMARLRARAPAS